MSRKIPDSVQAELDRLDAKINALNKADRESGLCWSGCPPELSCIEQGNLSHRKWEIVQPYVIKLDYPRRPEGYKTPAELNRPVITKKMRQAAALARALKQIEEFDKKYGKTT